MPDIYTHPNGWTIERRNGGLVATDPDGNVGYGILPDGVTALRDYLLAELGLWRDPETGLIVMTKADARDGLRRVIDPDNPEHTGWRGGGDFDARDRAVARYLATIAPPPREPKSGEVWRVTLDDGSECNALVYTWDTGSVWRSGNGWTVPISAYPPDRRRLLVEADGTVVSDE